MLTCCLAAPAELGVVGLLLLGVVGLLDIDPERNNGKRCGETVRFSDWKGGIISSRTIVQLKKS